MPYQTLLEKATPMHFLLTSTPWVTQILHSMIVVWVLYCVKCFFEVKIVRISVLLYLLWHLFLSFLAPFFLKSTRFWQRMNLNQHQNLYDLQRNFKGFLWDFYDISMWFLWESCGIPMGCSRCFYAISLGLLWDSKRISMGFSWYSSRIFMIFLWEFYDNSIGVVWDLNMICMGFL